MKKITLLIFCISLMCAPNAFGQALEEVQLYYVAIDTLLGTAADSTVQSNISLIQNGRYPKFVAISVRIVADINTGEGMTIRPNFGFGANAVVSALDTLHTAATVGQTTQRWYDMRVVGNAGNTLDFAQQAYASAADTDSISVSTVISGFYEMKEPER